MFHYDASDSLDAYYQEIGRGGRDGEPARTTLFYRPQDLKLHRFFAGGGQVTAADVRRLVALLDGRNEPLSFLTLVAEMALSRAKVARAIGLLQERGIVDRLATGEVTLNPADGARDATALAARALALQDWQRGTVQARIDLMRASAEASLCRRREILRYFGEDGPAQCDACDNCTSGRTARIAARMLEANGPDASALTA